jgi:Tfp pilus assembly protein PilF
LDDSLAEAHSSLALANLQYDYDFAAAAGRFRRAIELRPNYADAHANYAWLLDLEGRFDTVTIEARLALDLDPLSSGKAVLAAFSFISHCLARSRHRDDIRPAEEVGAGLV